MLFFRIALLDWDRTVDARKTVAAAGSSRGPEHES
jgi:hypothetical protein